MRFHFVVAPSIDPLLLLASNPTALADPIDGVIVTANPGTANIKFTVVVTSEPCPTVEWSQAGSILNSTEYTINDPCNIINQTYNFYLVIATLTANSSGQYSAMFSTMGGYTTINFTITIPGEHDSCTW